MNKQREIPRSMRELKIVSFNIQGATSNAVFAQEAFKDMDVICLQEHCLYDFEKHQIGNLFEHCQYQIRCVDEETGQSNSRRTAGHGGVVTLWKPYLNPIVTQQNEGNSRMVVTTLNLKAGPVSIINCYLPSGNKPEAVANFPRRHRSHSRPAGTAGSNP